MPLRPPSQDGYVCFPPQIPVTRRAEGRGEEAEPKPEHERGGGATGGISCSRSPPAGGSVAAAETGFPVFSHPAHQNSTYRDFKQEFRGWKWRLSLEMEKYMEICVQKILKRLAPSNGEGVS